METNNVHILFIDDRPDVIQEAREWLLEDFSYQNLETATSAQEAKEKLQQQSFDVIVADMRMERDDSGFEILDWVRDHNLSAVVIIFTANDTIEDCHRAFKSEAWDYISKNISGSPFETLHESMQAAIAYLNRWGNKPNEQWFEEHQAELEQKYWGQYIAIANKAVIESADTQEKLNQKLDELQLRRFTTTIRKIGDLRPIGDLLQQEESSILEFKSSLQWSVKGDCKDEKLQNSVLKTIAAFLNTEGGTLIIGVEDNGNIFGLEKDYNCLKKKNRDGFELKVVQLIENKIGKLFMSNIKINFENREGKDVCGVYVRKSEIPAFLIKVEQKDNTVFEFYRRFGNSSKQLEITEIYNFFLLGSDRAQGRRR